MKLDIFKLVDSLKDSPTKDYIKFRILNLQCNITAAGFKYKIMDSATQSDANQYLTYLEKQWKYIDYIKNYYIINPGGK